MHGPTPSAVRRAAPYHAARAGSAEGCSFRSSLQSFRAHARTEQPDGPGNNQLKTAQATRHCTAVVVAGVAGHSTSQHIATLHMPSTELSSVIRRPSARDGWTQKPPNAIAVVSRVFVARMSILMGHTVHGAKDAWSTGCMDNSILTVG